MLRSRTYTKIITSSLWLGAAILLLTNADSKDEHLVKIQENDDFHAEAFDSDPSETPITELVESHFGHQTNKKNSTNELNTPDCDLSLSKSLKTSYSKRLRAVMKNHHRISH